jgi:beta-glucosidase/6-phospho-beta-glucosidase/beta-galactosidase
VGTGAAHVRVNFRLDEWKSPTDATKVNGKTFFEAYDGITEAITSQGLEVYGLLNDELVSSGAPGSTELEDPYAANALAVVDRYKDRVRVWETLNEPNASMPCRRRRSRRRSRRVSR